MCVRKGLGFEVKGGVESGGWRVWGEGRGEVWGGGGGRGGGFAPDPETVSSKPPPKPPADGVT